MSTRPFIGLLFPTMLFMLPLLTLRTLAEERKPATADFVGVYESEKGRIILSAHPLYPEASLVATYFEEEGKVSAGELRNDPVKGCHGVMQGPTHSGAVEATLAGDKLVLQFYNRGPTLVFKRVKRD